MGQRKAYSTQEKYQPSKLNFNHLEILRSMEIHNVPFNNKGQGDQVNWHRYYVYQM